MAYKILHGGRIRWSASINTAAAYSGANVWEKGNILALQLTGYAAKVSAAADYNGTNVIGLTGENRTSAADDETLASGKAHLLLDEAVIRTDELASGVSNFEENQTLYSSTDGHITNADPGSGVIVGKSLGTLASDGNLDIFWSVQY